MIGFELGGDAIALGEPAGDSGILAGDDVDAGQCFQCPQRDVAEVADRGCHEIKAGRGFRRGQRLGAERIGPRSGRL